VDSGGSIVQAVNCGELAGGTITINPAAFTNQGTIAADDSGGLTPPFVYDTEFSGGYTGSTAAVISTSGVPAAPFAKLIVTCPCAVAVTGSDSTTALS